MRFIFGGATDQTIYVWLINSATGLGKTGLVYSDMTGSYVRLGAAREAITMATQTVTGSHSDGGFVEIDATNYPGLYRFDLPDAAVAAGVATVNVGLKASGVVTHHEPIQLVAWNLQVAAIPNAAADAAGGLPISDAGGLDLDAKLANTNEVTAARMGALTDWIDGGRLDLLLDAILLDTGTDGVVVASGSKTGYALTSGERDSIAAALLGLANGIEAGYTLKQAMRIMLSGLSGLSADHESNAPKYKSPAGTVNRISAATDANGNRTSVTLDASDE